MRAGEPAIWRGTLGADGGVSRRRTRVGRRAAASLAVLCGLLFSTPANAADMPPPSAEAPAVGGLYVPDLSRLLPAASDKQAVSSSIQILVLLTVLTVAPTIVLMTTCFVRMLVVLALLRHALGTQQLPPSQVLTALALFLTILVMAPTWDRIRTEALDPYMEDRISQLDAVNIAGRHVRQFMFDQIERSGNEQDVYLMYEYAAQRSVAADETISREDVPMTALIPAFLLSELKVSFVLGFRIFLPFLVIDMVIATLLVSMGMMMLPPVLVSLPFKLLLFVMADGWHLIGGSLMASVH